jgi:alpha-glucosidase (family GH31 glycosyl hydrolase)
MRRLIVLCLLLVPATARASLGDLTDVRASGHRVDLVAGDATVRLIFYRADVVRVDFLPGPADTLSPTPAVVADTSEAVTVVISGGAEAIEASTSALTVRATRRPLRLSFLDATGAQLLREAPEGGLDAVGKQRSATFVLGPDDRFYGSGARGIALDLRGRAFDTYNQPLYGYGDPSPSVNLNVPFLADPAGYGIYFDSTWPGRFDLGSSNTDRFGYTADGGELSFYVIAAPTVPDQIEALTWLTGRQPMPPRWALGYLQSKFGYRNEAEVRAVAGEFRRRGVPCDGIILDLYWQGPVSEMGNLSWDRSAWPDPFGMMRDLLDDGFRTIVITDPYLTLQSSKFVPALERGAFARTPGGGPYYLQDFWACGCPAGLVDLTNPAVQSWWWSLHPAFMGNTMAGLWTDLGEPERQPEDMVHYLGPAPEVHNIFDLLWAKTVFEGFRSFRPDRRFFNLTRSGFAGIQRYATFPWTGDVQKSFSGLAVQLPVLLNAGMSGIGYLGSDTGGFCCGTTTPELYARWMQFSCFGPVTRAHSNEQPAEPWAFGAQTEAVARTFLRLRYRLLPYRYTLAWENHETGMPLARPLFFADPEDPRLRNVTDAYLFGDAFLVAPVLHGGQRQKTVPLPAGDWVNYWTDERVEGGADVTVPAALESMPLLVRAPSLVPMQPDAEYSAGPPSDTLIVGVYPPAGDGESGYTLYEDDGQSLGYARGEFALTDISQTVATADSEVSIAVEFGSSRGSYTGMPHARVYRAEIHGMGRVPGRVTLNGARLASSGGPAGYVYDAERNLLSITFSASADSAYRVTAENVGEPYTEAPPETVFTAAMEQNVPNPFNGTTSISYQLRRSAQVDLRVYDVQGREVARLENRRLGPGPHAADFEGLDETGRPLGSGVYFYRLLAREITEDGSLAPPLAIPPRRMILLRGGP